MPSLEGLFGFMVGGEEDSIRTNLPSLVVVEESTRGQGGCVEKDEQRR